MIAIEGGALAGVVGGGTSTTTVRVGPFSYSRSQTDYELCERVQRQLAQARFPPIFLGPDRNRGARDAEHARLVREECGSPPR